MLMSKKVLIVEDDRLIGEIYRQRLSRAGYEVEVAMSGQKALDRLPEFRPDALLVDLMLPQMNGIALMKRIRALPEFKDVPIIVSTNAFLGEMIKDSIEAGATKVFNKSTLTPPLLLEVLREFFPVQSEEEQSLRQS